MSCHDAFLQEIIAHPRDDAPRLIYADWLEEQGDPRAEFIRTQCELARLPDDAPQRPALESREAQLLNQYGAVWLGLLPPKLRRPHFRRGFVETAEASLTDYLAEHPHWRQAAPILELRLQADRVSRDQWRSFAACPDLAAVTVLDLRRNEGASSVDGNSSPTPDEFAALLESPMIHSLTALRLANSLVREPILERLSHWLGLHRLTELAISSGGLETQAARPLIRSPYLTGVTHLWLRHLAGQWQPPWHPAQMAARCGRLRGLSLELCGCSGGVLEFLASLGNLQELEWLDLSGNSPRIVTTLLEGSLLRSAETLALNNRTVDDRAVEALARSPHVGGLLSLSLRYNVLSPHAVEALTAMSTNLAELRRLDLTGFGYAPHGGVGDRGAEFLAEASPPHLFDLSLARNTLSERATEALIRGPLWDNLVKLNLRQTRLTEEAARRLIARGPGRHLGLLDLRGNHFNDGHRTRLRGRYGHRLLL